MTHDANFLTYFWKSYPQINDCRAYLEAMGVILYLRDRVGKKSKVKLGYIIVRSKLSLKLSLI